MLKAIIFDFNGVVINDEPLHYAAMREVVAVFGIELDREAYWKKYLPLDDWQCLEAIASDNSLKLADEDRRLALKHKARAYGELIRQGLPLCPGASDFIRAAAALYPLAIASGARRQEIESTLESTGLRRYFVQIVGAEDFPKGKPHPESFLFALQRLNESLDLDPVRPEECLVIEDSVGGVHGSRAAGMVCLAVTNSYPRQMLGAANTVVNSLEEVNVRALNRLFGEFL